MDILEILYNLRHKKDKTEIENMLLDYHRKLFIICEICVDESKCHISSEDAVRKIREVLGS